MFDFLHLDILTLIITEWISSFHELVSLDVSLTGYCHREKYLLALKNLSKVEQLPYRKLPACSMENKLEVLMAWKENRGVLINKLILMFYTSLCDKVLLSFFPNLLSLTINHKEAEFDLSLVALGKCLPFLETLHLMNVKISFCGSFFHHQQLPLKELHLIENKYHSTSADVPWEYLPAFAKLCQKLKSLRFVSNENEYDFAYVTTKMVLELENLECLEYHYDNDVSFPFWDYSLNSRFVSKLVTVKLLVSDLMSPTSALIDMLNCCCNSNSIKHLSFSCFHIRDIDCNVLVNWIATYGHNLELIELGLYGSEIEGEEADLNPILQKISNTCKALQIFELKYFDSIDAATIQHLFRSGVCLRLHRVTLSDMTGASEILDALCKSNYPIDELVIDNCTDFQVTSLFKVIDTFQLKELKLLWLTYYNLLPELEDGQTDSRKKVLMKFMRKVMHSPNMQKMEHLSVEAFHTTVCFDTADDEKEILNYWLFPFPYLRSLTFTLSMNIDLLSMSTFLHRVLSHCPQLQMFKFQEQLTGVTKKFKSYDATTIRFLKNQSML